MSHSRWIGSALYPERLRKLLEFEHFVFADFALFK